MFKKNESELVRIAKLKHLTYLLPHRTKFTELDLDNDICQTKICYLIF